MKKSVLFVLLLSLLFIVSCSNTSNDSKPVGLFAERVGQVFADDAWSYDVVYKDSSSRYLSEVIVNLSNGTYRYPSSVKAEIFKKNGETWGTYKKDVTGKVTFTESGVYKVKYTAEGMTTETEEFNVYKPGEIIDFYATKNAYVEGIPMQKTDFSCTYCYKDENGNIGITSTYDKAKIDYYTKTPDYSFVTALSHDGTIQENYKYGETVKAGVIVTFSDEAYDFDMKEIEIKVVQQKDCDAFIKNYAYFSYNKSSSDYKFSGSIYKVLYYEGRPVAKIDILNKTETDVEITVGYTVKISDFILSDAPKSNTERIQALYNGVTTWNSVDPKTTFANKSTSEIEGAGYYMIQIWKDGVEITANDPAFIRVSKK
ncbi:MAG: hypothetical protein MSS69_03445 [Spirochaetales bacterium]|nr:hypothetical protein [Spirochaetales bacterium]